MSFSYPSMGITNSSAMSAFWGLVNWALSQVAPYLMILFAAIMVGMVARFIYVSIRPANVDYPFEQEEDD